MPITATCPHCTGSFTAPDSTAGKRFKCPSCKQPMTVPTAEEAAAAAAAGGDDVIDIPSPEEAEAMVGGDDEDEDDADDAEEEAEDDADEDEDAGKKSKRDRKSKRDKGKKDKKKKEKKPKVKKERADIEMPEVDANAAIGNVIGSLTRALHPSRVLTAAIGMALVLLTALLLAGIGIATQTPIVIYLLGGLAVLVLGVGNVVVMVAVAKVDLADLRGEEVPGPLAALKSAIGGGVGAVIAAFLIQLLLVGVLLVEGLVGLLAAIPYIGGIFGLPLVPAFFLIDLALFAGLPLIMWLLVPLAADGGANPLAPIKGAIGRVRREPARLAISFILFIVFSNLILGVLWAVAAGAAYAAGMTIFSMHALGGVLGSTPGQIMALIGSGTGAAIVVGLVLSPPIAAYVCSGCQEIAENPWDEDDE